MLATRSDGRKRVIGLKNPQSRPWPVTSQLAEHFKGASKTSANAWPPDQRAGEAAKAVEAAGLELGSGATLGAVSGVRSIRQLCSTIVLIAEVDKRRAVLATPGE
jgi:hypothetical protein